MTNKQVFNTVKMLLDDYNQVFHTEDLISRFIDAGQMQLIKAAYKDGNERLLRPLYRREVNLLSGDVIEKDIDANPPAIPIAFVAERLLFPKVCMVYHEFDGDDDTPGVQIDKRTYKQVKYLERGLFDNIDLDVLDYYNTFGRYYYTIDVYREGIANVQDQRHILKHNIKDPIRIIKAELTYICKPYLFNSINRFDFSNRPLQIPVEYHPQVCFLAADMMNQTDVLEMDRGGKTELVQRDTIPIGKL